MILKSLELNGFKSFPDKTVLNFEMGSTMVVGPNGSGKSNISDAMRWVLGEISSRNIRGTKMEDVIFGGTDKRRQMSYAEVSVTFDNTDEENRANLPYDEVTVTRKYFRSGDSEYYINRKPVRLKDIHELFMNTGVGRTGYSIIGQGRIAEIVSQKSEDRRGIFEEAAGIAKYKYKKNEAERKLMGVSDNLTRVNDILSELESRVGPLEKEAEKARKYLEYYEHKKRADISLWVYDIEHLTEDIEKSEGSFIIAKRELEAIEESLASLEAQDERTFRTSQENKLEYERMTAQIAEDTKRMHDLDSASRLAENNITHREALKALKREEIAKLEEKLAAAEETIAQAEEVSEILKDKLEDILRRHLGLENDKSQNEKEIKRLADEIEALLAKIRENEQSIVDMKLRLSALDNAKESGSEQKRALSESIGKYKESVELLEGRIKQADEKIADYDKRADAIKAECADTDARLAEIAGEVERLNGESNQAYLDMSLKEHRVSTLKRMDELLEGYAQSVRFVINEYEDGRIDGCGSIYGPVSRLISVSERYSLAIETALGANLQNIVVDNEGTAKAAMRHLKNKNAGRATFYPISSMKARSLPVSEKEAEKYRGYLGIADSVLTYDKIFDPVIKSLLGATLLFDNIDNATVMAKATGYKTRIVTLDGQIINAGGSFTGGSAKRESGMLTRTSEIERLEAEIEKLQKKQSDLKAETDKYNDEAARLQSEVSGKKGNLAIIESLRNAENTQLEVLKSQFDSDKRMLEELTGDLERLDSDSDKNVSEYEAVTDRCAELEAENAAIGEKRSELDVLKYEIEQKNSELDAQMAELGISAAETKRDIENSIEQLDMRKAAADEVRVSIDEAKAQIDKYDSDNTDAVDSIESGKREIVELEEKIRKTEEARQANSEEGRAIEKRLMDLRARIKDNNDRKENVVREYTKLENKCANLNSELDKMTSRLWDEYELTYTTACECGYERVTQSTRSTVVAEQTEYRNKIKGLGSVNVNAVEEYASVKERYDFLSAQVEDLEKSKEELLEIITGLEGEMCENFVEAFEKINKNFRIVFRELFGGGEAELSLTDPENVLTSGIEIRVAPPGKIIKSLMLLSGGEQSFVAIALIFAILRVNPTPFCIFDEIEAALDEANVFRFADYIKRYSDRNQFIVITHRRPTMEVADKLYGVTMYEKGISKVLTLDVGEIEEKIGLKA